MDSKYEDDGDGEIIDFPDNEVKYIWLILT